jgi:polar amino acid transport system ATP-binding protein
MKLELQNLNKAFSGQQVLKDLSYLCDNCQSLVLLGPSGCGKSTLLRILAGLLPADSGSIRINNGDQPSTEKELRGYRQKLGIVFQSSNLFPNLSAFNNLLLPLEKVHGYTKGRAHSRIDYLLNHFQLRDHAHKKPAQLSGGQRQRIAIARALAHEPKLLLLDEPTSALDPEMAAEVLNTIEVLKKEGTDFILVTHQIPFARRVADQVLFLNSGHIHESGPASSLLENPQSPLLRDFLRKHFEY